MVTQWTTSRRSWSCGLGQRWKLWWWPYLRDGNGLGGLEGLVGGEALMVVFGGLSHPGLDHLAQAKVWWHQNFAGTIWQALCFLDYPDLSRFIFFSLILNYNLFSLSVQISFSFSLSFSWAAWRSTACFFCSTSWTLLSRGRYSFTDFMEGYITLNVLFLWKLKNGWRVSPIWKKSKMAGG